MHPYEVIDIASKSLYIIGPVTFTHEYTPHTHTERHTHTHTRAHTHTQTHTHPHTHTLMHTHSLT